MVVAESFVDFIPNLPDYQEVERRTCPGEERAEAHSRGDGPEHAQEVQLVSGAGGSDPQGGQGWSVSLVTFFI